MNQYRHNAVGQTVYKFPKEPNVTERKNGHGHRTGWLCTLDVTITRADNKLTGSQWEHATSAHLPQDLDPRYTREQAVSFFMMRHAPKGETLSEAEYLELHDRYEALALAR
jgi:hypothetical protein